MNLPKPKIDAETAMSLWISERSEYAKEQVVLCHTGLIGAVMNRLEMDLLYEDLFSIGIIGLIKAVNTFDADKGVRFSTYATTLIHNELLMPHRKQIAAVISINRIISFDDERETEADVMDDRNYEEEAIANDNYKRMLMLLNENEKKAVFLRLHGLTQKQIAKICRTSQNAISLRLAKAKKIYKKLSCEEY